MDRIPYASPPNQYFRFARIARMISSPLSMFSLPSHYTDLITNTDSEEAS